MAITYQLDTGPTVTVQTGRVAPTYAIGALVHWTTIPTGYGGVGFGPVLYVPPLARVAWYYNAPTTPPGGSLWGPLQELRIQRQRTMKTHALEDSLLIVPRAGLVGALYWIVDTP